RGAPGPAAGQPQLPPALRPAPDPEEPARPGSGARTARLRGDVSAGPGPAGRTPGARPVHHPGRGQPAGCDRVLLLQRPWRAGRRGQPAAARRPQSDRPRRPVAKRQRATAQRRRATAATAARGHGDRRGGRLPHRPEVGRGAGPEPGRGAPGLPDHLLHGRRQAGDRPGGGNAEHLLHRVPRAADGQRARPDHLPRADAARAQRCARDHAQPSAAGDPPARAGPLHRGPHPRAAHRRAASRRCRRRAGHRRSRRASPARTPDLAGRDLRQDLLRCGRGDKDAAARMALRARSSVAGYGSAAQSRYEGWLQFAVALGNGIASYELALHFRSTGQPLLASQFEARARELGYTPPPDLDNVRK
ncbi:hypothetical protein OSTOST_14153, partial [Ostertagia ostertagi]